MLPSAAGHRPPCLQLEPGRAARGTGFCVGQAGSGEEGVGMGWPHVDSATRQGQPLGWGDRPGRYWLLIFTAQRPKFSGRKGRPGHLLWVGQKVHSGVSMASYRKTRTNFLANPILVPGSERQRAQAGYVEGTTQRGNKRLNHGKGLKDHLSPVSWDRLGS